MTDFLPPGLYQAGARQHQRRAPDPITAEWLVEEAARQERVLRLQYEDGSFPAAWEQALGELRGDEITTALQRWCYLKHLWRVWHEGLAARDADAPSAARALMRREPVVIWLGRHRVQVTGRSYSAMAEIAVHDLTKRRLEEDLQHVATISSQLQAELGRIPLLDLRRRRHLRRRLKLLAGIYQRAYTERELHRRAIYAHALTAHGGPAADPQAEAPTWWRELGDEQDAELLIALFQAGPLRFQALGNSPPSKSGGMELREDFGFASIFAAWEKEHGLRPGELYDRDLGQLLTAMRAGAMELPERGPRVAREG